MRQSYKIVSGKSSVGHRRMAEFPAKEGQLLLPSYRRRCPPAATFGPPS